mgnify:CR=1 FL=1
MALNQNKRIFWATEAVGFAEDGTLAFTPAHGVQSLGITTTFNLTQVYELGQISIYENLEDLPDVEVTLEKAIDGYPLLYHLATPNAASPTLAGRSNDRCILGVSIYGDVQNSASGVPTAQMTCSGMYISSLAYNFPVDNFFTESVTLVGNNKVWASGTPYTFSGGFLNNDAPPSGIQRRQHFEWGNHANSSHLPGGVGGIPGLSSSGYNSLNAAGAYNATIQGISVSTDLGREALLELGSRNPFFRYATFPVEVTCDIEVLTKDGDFIAATEAGVAGNGNNLVDKEIVIAIDTGLRLDLGTKNKLSSVSYGGADAGGGNATCTYSYTTFNDLTVTDPTDPAGF